MVQSDRASLRLGLESLSRQYRDWKTRRLVVRRAGFTVFAVAVTVLGFYAVTSQSDWERRTILKHFAAYPNCDAARAVGLAPAQLGEPGYFGKHDRDKDGIACEVWPRR